MTSTFNTSPPGTSERVAAASALAIAPHPDDEVLGPGGLLAQLAASGSAVRVLFLSDGGGGTEGGIERVEDRAAYRARRRDESARAAEILGLSGCDALDLPDGALSDHLDEIAAGIRRAILSQRPELLLVPSPLEASPDHRAAFAALHRLLAPLRSGSTSSDGALSDFENLRILVYEVNRPGYPDLLVDVSAEADLLERAFAAHRSQAERHPYWNAALGLRRHRTLSLAPGVDLAEGYRRLTVDDFRTRSGAQLIRHLGGLPDLLEVREGPSVSVVVRTKDRPELLREALASVALQTYTRVEVVLVNDGGAPPQIPADFPFPIVRVDLGETRGRAAAAQAGIEAATGAYLAFLDDDDLAAPEHLATLAALVQGAGVQIAYTDAAVAIYELGGSTGAAGWICRERRLPYSRDFDPDLLLLDNYIPFNTVLIERQLLLAAGPLDASLPFFEDWDLLIRLAALAPFHHLAAVTCEYRHFRGAPHHVFGERPRERSDFLAVKERVIGKHAGRIGPDLLARAVDTLRREEVEAREEAARRKAEVAGLRGELAAETAQFELLERAHSQVSAERFAWEERYHSAHGAEAALGGENERLTADLARQVEDLTRLYAEAQALRGTIDEQTAHLGRTYAEIERLNGLIRTMEATRAWRLHKLLR
ncbi:MAG: PIG-L family deacetylase [Acidobacteriota bacterium]